MNVIAENKYDIGVGDVTILSERLDIVDFTIPTVNSELVIIAKQTDNKNNIFSFLSPFSLELWLGIAFAFLVTSILLCILLR